MVLLRVPVLCVCLQFLLEQVQFLLLLSEFALQLIGIIALGLEWVEQYLLLPFPWCDIILQLFQFPLQLFNPFGWLLYLVLQLDRFLVFIQQLLIGLFRFGLQIVQDVLLLLIFVLPVVHLTLDVLLGLEQVVQLVLIMCLHFDKLLLLSVQLGLGVVEFLSHVEMLGG